MVKYCKNCGTEVDDDGTFCTECGYNFAENRSTEYQHNVFNSYKIDIIPGEKVVRNSQIHEGCLYLPGIVVVIGFFIGFLMSLITSSFGFLFLNPLLWFGLIWFVIRYIGYKHNDLILTNKRVFGKCGLISTIQMQSPLNKIDSVTFANGLIGKMIGYGTVTIATTSSVFKFRFIRDGHTFYNDIFNQLEFSDEEKRVKDAEAIAQAISDN